MNQKLLKFKKELITATIFFLLTLLVIFIWFKGGFLYGGGDVGLPIYNPIKMLNMSRYPWWEAVAPGFLIPLSVTAVPFEFGLSLLQSLGFSDLMLQATTFFLLFFLMGFGMYLFLLTLFKNNHFLSVLGALFYLFNPYMLISVWHRFVHTSIFFVALLPYIAIFWRKWIKEGKLRYLLIFLLINFLGSYLFGTLAFIVTLWLFLFVLTILESTIPFAGKRLFVGQIIRFGLGFIGWLLTNSWWLIPTIFIASSQYGQQYDQGANLVSFIEISKQAILPFSLQQVNPFNLYQQLDFGSIYNSFLFRVIPWVGVTVVLLGLIQALKQKQMAFFSIFTLIILFLTKGSSEPLGNLFVWGLRHFFFLGVIRNPSEKIGILLSFLYAILFIIGLSLIKDYLNRYLSKSYVNVFLILILMPGIIFCWPIFTGRVFANLNNSIAVRVPDSYMEVNNFIKDQLVGKSSQEQGRILHLPLSVSEALTYNWDAGYHGTDSSSLFFDSLPSISRGLNLPKFDDPLKGLAFSFMQPYSQDHDAILKALQSYNVEYIILHKDADFLTDGIVNPEEIEKVLNNLAFLKKVTESGKLSVYKLEEADFKSKIVLFTDPSYIRTGDNNHVWLFLANRGTNLISESPESQVNKNMYPYLAGGVIFPDTSFRYFQASGSALLNDTFHTAVTDKLKSVMQQAKQNGNLAVRDLIRQFLEGSQSVRDLFLSNQNFQISSLNRYEDTVGGLLGHKSNFSRLLVYLDGSILRLFFQEQLLMLDQLKSVPDESLKGLAGRLSDKIIRLAIENDLFPRTVAINEIKLGADRQVFNLSLPEAGDYQIFMTKAFDPTIFENNLVQLPVLLDGQKIVLSSSSIGDVLSFGSKKIEGGLHEISYPTLTSKNLLDLQNIQISQGKMENGEINLNATNIPAFFEIPFSGIEGGGLYHFNLEILLKQGSSLYFQLSQDSDPLDQNKQPIMQINQPLRKQDIGEGWRTLSFDNTLRMTTKQAKIRIILTPEASILESGSSMAVRNLSVQKVLNNTIYVKTENNNVGQGSDDGVTKLVHPTPVSYSGEINVLKPAFLILKETYNPGWTLTIKSSDNSIYQPKDHLIGDLYGNAWFIDKPGKYSFEIKFSPFKYNVIGFWLSFISYLFLVVVLIFRKLRRKIYG